MLISLSILLLPRLILIIVLILTHSMVQSPSWEANWLAASQEIPRISRNPKVPYRTHKPPPPVSILGPPNPVHIPTSHLLEIHPNIIHPSSWLNTEINHKYVVPVREFLTLQPMVHRFALHFKMVMLSCCWHVVILSGTL